MPDFRMIIQLTKESFLNPSLFEKRVLVFQEMLDGETDKTITNYSDLDQTVKDNIEVVINNYEAFISSILVQSVNDVLTITYLKGTRVFSIIKDPYIQVFIKNHALAVYDELKPEEPS